MPPKKKFSKEQIIDSAFEIARVEGIDSVTIRKVAQRLGSSIAPIYVNFVNSEELIQEVVNRTFEVSRQLLIDQNTGNPFHDIGMASLRFAKEYSVLFRDLVMKPSQYKNEHEDNYEADLIKQMKLDKNLQGFSEEELREILLKMRIFQVGLCVMVANQLLPESFDDQLAIQMLESTATDVITSIRLRKNNEVEEK